MTDSHNNDSATARAEQESITRSAALAEIIAAHTQPDDATHLSLEESEYLAEGNVRIEEGTRRNPGTPATPRPAGRVFRENKYLESAHMRLQAILNDTDDDDAERRQIIETAEEGDEETRRVEKQVPLLYHPRFLLRAYYVPERIEGLLRPFHWHPPLDFDAPVMHYFERQSLRFQEFQRFQAINRGIDTLEPSAMEEAYHAALIREATNAHHWRELVATPGCNGSLGRRNEFWARRVDEKELLREEACSNFDEYQAAVRARLARNGVEVPANFALLNEDFARQDRLTMWSEYLAFELWFMEQYDDDVRRYRPSHDVAYAQLRRVVALRPHETAEFLPTKAAATQRNVEVTEALSRQDMAELAFRRLQMRPPPGRRNHANLERLHVERARQLAEAQAEIEAAEEAKIKVMRRNEAVVEFLKETGAWREARDNRSRHDALLAWATDRWYDIRTSAGIPLPGEEEETIRSLNPDLFMQADCFPAGQGAAAAQRTADAAGAQVESVIAEDREQEHATVTAAAEAGPSSDEDKNRDSVPPDVSPLSSAVPSPSVSPRSLTGLRRVTFASPHRTSSRSTESTVIEVPLVEQPSAEEPSVERPSDEKPVVEELSMEQSSVEKLPLEQPLAEDSSAKELTVEQSSTEKPPLEQPLVKEPSKDQPGNELPPVEQSVIVPPLVRQIAEEQRLPVTAAFEGTATVTRATATAVPELRRSARIAARRLKAAEKAALQKAQANIPETTTKVRGASNGTRKRGRGKAAAEDETKDAERPAKRTRGRTARK
ncbi:Sperm acrosomal protein FSA-ACR.1 [Beauveria bassiana D1-5]|uniref:Sperm acrosomal protein FSA-ACR.1 n=1 Tax=Beauveria bassiana D1-5 TaxID=1245745 RepID=A0A0A2VV53_BEABA|nr:Sperm acrosomal protein FSA-ACR.1 [Beauveria bassiana D1-5]